MDADQIAAVVSKGIPVTEDERIYHIVILDPSSEMPTDEELEMIALYRRFSARIYTDKAKEEILKLQFPVAQGHNTTFFKKEPFGDWSYRRRLRSKELPWLPDTAVAWTLLQVFEDAAQASVSHWKYWKSRYKVFQGTK